MDDALREESSLDGSESTEEHSEEEQSWIAWFCSIRGNEFFCEVDEDYIHDEFNLTGLSSEVPYFDYALDTILDVDSPNADLLTEEQQETVDAAAELLYGLIHARYILSSKGLTAMYDKFQDVEFGRCCRVLCEGQPLLPVGQSDLPRKFTVSTYCPRCNDIYFPKSSRHANIDGAYFGTTFPHLFLMTYPACVPPPPSSVYTPRIFGFRIRRESAADAATTPPAGAQLPGDDIRSVGPSGPAPTPSRGGANTASGPVGGSSSAGGRGKDVATVLPRDVMASVRRAGQDDFFDEDELEQAMSTATVTGPTAAASAAAATSKPGHHGGGALDGLAADANAFNHASALAGAGAGANLELEGEEASPRHRVVYPRAPSQTTAPGAPAAVADQTPAAASAAAGGSALHRSPAAGGGGGGNAAALMALRAVRHDAAAAAAAGEGDDSEEDEEDEDEAAAGASIASDDEDGGGGVGGGAIEGSPLPDDDDDDAEANSGGGAGGGGTPRRYRGSPPPHPADVSDATGPVADDDEDGVEGGLRASAARLSMSKEPAYIPAAGPRSSNGFSTAAS